MIQKDSSDFIFISISFKTNLLLSPDFNKNNSVGRALKRATVFHFSLCFPGGSGCKKSACQCRRYETWVHSLGWRDFLEKGMATYSNILAWQMPQIEESVGYGPWGRKKSDTTEATARHQTLRPI